MGCFSGCDCVRIPGRFGPHDKIHGKNATPERVMFNFETKDVKGEFERIKKLGAAVVAKPYHPTEDPKGMITTFADPDNNYFQTPWKKPNGLQTPCNQLPLEVSVFIFSRFRDADGADHRTSACRVKEC